jgi:hypothetical protein
MDGGFDALQMLNVFSSNLPGFQSLLIMLAYLIGFAMLGAGLWLWATNDGRGGNAWSGFGIAGLILAGAFLLAFLESVQILSNSLFDAGNPRQVLAEVPVDRQHPGNMIWMVAINLLAIIGWYGVLRGFYAMGMLGNAARQETWGRVCVWFIGGTCLINGPIFVAMLARTVGADAVLTVLPGS